MSHLFFNCIMESLCNNTTKLIIFIIGFIVLGVIGLIMDNQWDKKHTPRADQYNNVHYSNCALWLWLFWSVFAGGILFLL